MREYIGHLIGLKINNLYDMRQEFVRVHLSYFSILWYYGVVIPVLYITPNTKIEIKEYNSNFKL